MSHVQERRAHCQSLKILFSFHASISGPLQSNLILSLKFWYVLFGKLLALVLPAVFQLGVQALCA